MTSTQIFDVEAVAAEQRELRQVSVDMLVDLVGLSVDEARRRVFDSICDDRVRVDLLGCRNGLIAAREAVDDELAAEWGFDD